MAKTRPAKTCKNCKHALTNKFCPSCGQRNTTIRQPVHRHVGEFCGDQLSLDSRAIRTVLPFLFWPGFLTREFNEGRRVRYTSPIKLYLGMSVLLFVGLGVTRMASDLALFEQMSVARSEAMEEAFDELRSMPAAPGDESELGHQVRETLREVNDVLSTTPTHYQQSVSQTLLDLLGEDHPVAVYVDDKMARLREMDWAEARLAGFDNWLNLLPTAMFLLMPFCALLLKVCFVGTGRYYAEHLVFALHLHAFIYFIMLALSLFWTPAAVALAAILIAVHILVAVRTAYRVSLFGTAVRGVSFTVLYVLLLAAGLGVTFWISLLMI